MVMEAIDLVQVRTFRRLFFCRCFYLFFSFLSEEKKKKKKQATPRQPKKNALTAAK